MTDNKNHCKQLTFGSIKPASYNRRSMHFKVYVQKKINNHTHRDRQIIVKHSRHPNIWQHKVSSMLRKKLAFLSSCQKQEYLHRTILITHIQNIIPNLSKTDQLPFKYNIYLKFIHKNIFAFNIKATRIF